MGEKCPFFGKFGVLCFLETLVLGFALLHYYRRLPDTGILKTKILCSRPKFVWKRSLFSQSQFFLKPYRPNMPSFRGVRADHKKAWKQINMHTDIVSQRYGANPKFFIQTVLLISLEWVNPVRRLRWCFFAKIQNGFKPLTIFAKSAQSCIFDRALNAPLFDAFKSQEWFFNSCFNLHFDNVSR